MCNGVVGETSELMQKRGEQMSQEYRFVTEMILGLSTTILDFHPMLRGGQDQLLTVHAYAVEFERLFQFSK
jgi:hypothetical protein